MYRRLTQQEIKALSAQGCRCEDWTQIEVEEEGFNTGFVLNVNFSGKIKIGRLDEEIIFREGIKRHAGIFDAAIHNCTVGNNVYISHVNSFIANYIIEDNVVVENVDVLSTEGICSFGNGLPINVMDETGGRAVTIYDGLSANLAYIMVLYRYRPAAVNRISEMIKDYSTSVESDKGTVARNARLTGCRTVKNMRIGEYACIDGVQSITNGTVNSCREAPVYIGPGVIADNFIVCSNSEISHGAEIFDTFVGQGCVIGKQYSSDNSLFFANCQALHGEACAVFAGPYTVTHHKSTLLIAGYYSFMNAGSGSNQSNHMYKLGPVHHGIMERGAKTASDSYIMWPARIGAFTLVTGRHYKHPDTSDMPFSYLIESDGESVLAPGINLRSAGTVRDAQKWPERDRRTDPNRLDCINFNLLNPFSVNRILKGIDILKNLKTGSGNTHDYYYYKRTKINRHALENGLKLYETALHKFLGNSLIKRLGNLQFKSVEDLRKHLLPDTAAGIGEWIDMAGLISPKSEIERLMLDIETGVIDTLDAISERFAEIHRNYCIYEWVWVTDRIRQLYGTGVEEFTFADAVGIIEKWKESVVFIDNLLYSDAQKEFALTSRIGFGIDGSDDDSKLDFEQVRGKPEENAFLQAVQNHIQIKTKLGDELIARLQNFEK
jgi:NDP-sugar pyrophosphorylase family protein